MPIEENMAAGISKCFFSCRHVKILISILGVGAFVFALGITRTIHLVGTFTPTPVIKGKFRHLTQ